MNDDRSGIDLLRKSIEEVAAALPLQPVRLRRRVSARTVGILVAAVLLLTVAGVWGLRGTNRSTAPEVSMGVARLGVEVKVLRIRGRDVRARVFDAAKAGTIVVAPDVDRALKAGRIQAVLVLAGEMR